MYFHTINFDSTGITSYEINPCLSAPSEIRVSALHKEEMRACGSGFVPLMLPLYGFRRA
jgi:hypothetical protein